MSHLFDYSVLQDTPDYTSDGKLECLQAARKIIYECEYTLGDGDPEENDFPWIEALLKENAEWAEYFYKELSYEYLLDGELEHFVQKYGASAY